MLFIPHVVAQSLTRVKSSNAFARVLRSTSSGVVPLISAIFFITYGMFDESFLVPRCGSGAMYGVFLAQFDAIKKIAANES